MSLVLKSKRRARARRRRRMAARSFMRKVRQMGAGGIIPVEGCEWIISRLMLGRTLIDGKSGSYGAAAVHASLTK
jgi:hypothetical protein